MPGLQDSLFDDAPAPSSHADAGAPQAEVRKRSPATAGRVRPVAVPESLHALAAALPRELHLGTSSWHFPGWAGLVWEREYAQPVLSRHGLAAYGRHPLLRGVSLDRSFYRPLSASQFAGYAAQVPDDFRFVVKAPSLVADALVRGEDGRGMQPNPAFLDPTLAVELFVAPAIEGLGTRIGALVFQLSPLPAAFLARMPEMLDRLSAMLRALPRLRPAAPEAVVAVEVRNPEWLTPELVAALRDAGATYCLGLHPKLPPIDKQIPLLRALWPRPLVCRWNLNRKHGAFGYEDAKGLYEPFDRLIDPDLETRDALARVIAGTVGAGQPAYVTINNKAEGSAPLSVAALAEAVRARLP
ncbi:Uncharacterised protein [Xylophilus ampelinus]|nr:DUF72 domain-containing protein [Variovorax sp.]VTY37599.1 Uncharacterised protein [Xylophilus ampelinus]